jgi:hypothetical protein
MESGGRYDGRENCSDSSCTRVLEDNVPVAGRRCHWDRHQEERTAVVGVGPGPEVAAEAGTGTLEGRDFSDCGGYKNGTGRAGCCVWWEVASEAGLIRGS